MPSKPVTKPRTTCPDGSPHHWILSDPSGGIVGGACKRCGRERTFSPAVDDWNGRLTPRQESLAGQKRWDGYDRRLADEVMA